MLISIIIPTYNRKKECLNAIDSILTNPFPEDVEVIVIDDGSTDGTFTTLQNKFQDKENVKIYYKKNGGVSSARNKGIDLATGEYIVFLDSDDIFAPNTLIELKHSIQNYGAKCDVFVIPIYLNSMNNPHLKMQDLPTGMIDLTKKFNINQTTINVCVKNKKIKFNQNIHYGEDTLYINKNLENLEKIYILNNGGYIYNQIENESLVEKSKTNNFRKTKLLNYYLYILELYGDFKWAQSNILYDIRWRLVSKNLFPYYIESEKNLEEEWYKKFNYIIDKIDINVFKNQRFMDIFHKEYLLKSRAKMLYLSPNEIDVVVDNEFFYTINKFEVVFTRYKLYKDVVNFSFFVKIPFINESKFSVYIITSEKKEILKGKDSVYGHHRSREKTNTFWFYEIELNISKKNNFKIELHIEDRIYPINKFFIMNDYLKFYNNNLKLKDNEFTFFIESKRKKSKIWIYQDRDDLLDNAYYQFIHDIQKNDGIKRKYITKNESVQSKYKNNTILYGSNKHRRIVSKSEKIITSFNNVDIIFPFANKKIRFGEIIYLQHGVLHAKTPWIYGKEKNIIDKIVISTYFEKNNFINNYGYNKNNLILEGMPKLNKIKISNQEIKNILFAPSWRESFKTKTGKLNKLVFDKSEYKKNLDLLISSTKLKKYLRANNMKMYYQLHPLLSDHIRIDEYEKYTGEEKIDIFITDFSSMLYYYYYAGAQIITFNLDFEEFKSGNHIYDSFDIDFDFTFSASNVKELINNIRRINNAEVKNKKDFFLKNMMFEEGIYNNLIGEK